MKDNPWLTIAAAAIPEVAALIKALLALRKKYPTALSAADIAAAVASITAEADTAFDDVLARIAFDEKAHPPTP
jgi:hypothetical protein